jgi:hypothetical protein
MATASFTITVTPSAYPDRWPCTWLAGLGIPYELVGGATTAMASDADPESPAVSLFPAPGTTASGLFLHPGPAQGIAFTTVLDFTAPEGAGLDLFLPPDPKNPNAPPLVSLRVKGAGYNVKANKRSAADPSTTMRALAVNTNGQWLEPLSFTAAEMAADGVLDLASMGGATNFHVTVALNLQDGSLSIEFPGSVKPSASGRKGWDGCIYGPDRPVKKLTSRVMLIPPAAPGIPPITDLYLYASGVGELPIQQPTLTAQGKRWGDGHVTLMKAYDDGVEFRALGNGGGVHAEFGEAASFSLRMEHFENGDLPNQEALFRIGIGPLALTNRPAPPLPPIDLRLADDPTGAGVACAVDFSALGASNLTLQLWSSGALVKELHHVDGKLNTPGCTLSRWPGVLGCPGVGVLSLSDPAPFSVSWPDGSSDSGDELRLLPELPAGVTGPAAFGRLDMVTSAEATWRLHVLQVNPSPLIVPLRILCPDNLVTAATSTNGATVTYFPTVLFGDCPLLPVADLTCTPPSGSVFPIGTTTVTCSAHNGCGETTSCSFTVTVNAPLVVQVPEHFFPTNALPPANGLYFSPAQGFATYANGIIIRDIRHRRFAQGFRPPDPGTTNVNRCDSQVAMEVSMDGGLSFASLIAPASVSVSIQASSNPGLSQAFDTEMLQLDIPGGTLPAGMRLRESPTRQSKGKTTVRAVPGGYMISSFFDIFTEVSLDGGQTWSPAQGAGHVELGSDAALVPAVQEPTNLLPPPNGFYTSAQGPYQLAPRLRLASLRSRLFSHAQAPPTTGPDTVSCDAQLDLELSTDDGASFQAVRCPAPLAMQVAPASAGADQLFDTEMLSLSCSVPGTIVMIRESPTEPSRGQTEMRAQADGTYRISSFFDIFLELSLDGGLTWTPATCGPIRLALQDQAPEHLFLTPNLPPPGGYAGLGGNQLYANGVLLSNLVQDHFTQAQPPPPPGGSQTESFGSRIRGLISLNGGASFAPFSASADAGMRVSSSMDSGSTRFFDTEMLSLNLAGGTLPGGIMVRESPSKASLGRTSIRQSATTYRISSFFDIFTEISLDGGQNWSPSVGAPATLAVAALRPVLSVGFSPANLSFSWSAGGVLQQSTDLINWTDVPGATSPFPVIPIGSNMFYRISQ